MLLPGLRGLVGVVETGNRSGTNIGRRASTNYDKMEWDDTEENLDKP